MRHPGFKPLLSHGSTCTATLWQTFADDYICGFDAEQWGGGVRMVWAWPPNIACSFWFFGQTLLQFLVLLQSTHQLITAPYGPRNQPTAAPPGVSDPTLVGRLVEDTGC